MRPMINKKISESNQKWAFVCANRVGKEETTVFCGCSCVVLLNKGAPSIVDAFDKRSEELRIVSFKL